MRNAADRSRIRTLEMSLDHMAKWLDRAGVLADVRAHARTKASVIEQVLGDDYEPCTCPSCSIRTTKPSSPKKPVLWDPNELLEELWQVFGRNYRSHRADFDTVVYAKLERHLELKELTLKEFAKTLEPAKVQGAKRGAIEDRHRFQFTLDGVLYSHCQPRITGAQIKAKRHALPADAYLIELPSKSYPGSMLVSDTYTVDLCLGAPRHFTIVVPSPSPEPYRFRLNGEVYRHGSAYITGRDLRRKLAGNTGGCTVRERLPKGSGSLLAVPDDQRVVLHEPMREFYVGLL